MTNLTSRMAVFGPNMMFADLRCSPSCTRAGVHGTVSICPPDCFEYKGTLDVFYKIIRRDLEDYGEAPMLALHWLYQLWESICLAMTSFGIGLKSLQLKMLQA
ncbi:hypothetical protein Lser_V15G03257 [Lactuca serriola]